MKVVIEGCCHGELDKIYDTITLLERKNTTKVDLLIICGDFQAVRNFDDLQAMAVPQKFQKLNSFYKYYSGEKVAPVLTVFIGGNHEASNFLQELPYGGWVAKNIYYMGYAGIIQVGGVRIGGISGIFKGHDFNRGHFERPPYDEKSKRSVYHVRNLEVFRLKQISRHVDIFFSHDWPEGIYHHGDVNRLIRRKPFFRDEIEKNCLGSKPCADILNHLQPSYWFAAHLHVKFAAHVEHKPSENGVKRTKFLALDKCLPGRQFLQVLDIPHKEEEGLKIKLDPEWLTILQSTNHLLHLSPSNCHMPGPLGNERYDFTVTDTQLTETEELFGNDLTLPENFEHTAPPLRGNVHQRRRESAQFLSLVVNPQTTLLCTMLNITDPNAKFLGKTSQQIMEENSQCGPGSERNGIEDLDDTMADSPSFIDSSLDVSSQSAFNSSSGFDSFSETASSNKNGTPDFRRSLVSSTVKEEELKAILSAQKKLVTQSSSVSSTSSSLLTSTTDSERDFKDSRAISRRESIADRLKALKGNSHKSSTSSVDSQVSTEDSSESKGCLNKLDTVQCSEDSDELQAILACQKRKQASISAPCESSPVDSSSEISKSVCNDRSGNGRENSSSESSGMQVPHLGSVSSSGKKMKRRNLSMYDEQQE